MHMLPIYSSISTTDGEITAEKGDALTRVATHEGRYDEKTTPLDHSCYCNSTGDNGTGNAATCSYTFINTDNHVSTKQVA